MLVELNKTKIPTETNPASTVSTLTNDRFPIEVYNNFGAKGFCDALRLALSKAVNGGFFKAYVIGIESKPTMFAFRINQSRNTAFIFNTFKALGMSLPSMMLQFGEDDAGVVALELPQKIYAILSKMDQEIAEQLISYIYDLCRTLKALSMIEESMLLTGSEAGFNAAGLDVFNTQMGSLKENTLIDVRQLPSGVEYNCVRYVCSAFTSPVYEGIKPATACTYLYNKMTAPDGSNFIVITNTSFKIKTHYVISASNGLVCTDDALEAMNTLDSAEWLASLMIWLCVTYGRPFTLRHYASSILMKSKHPELVVSEDIDDESIMKVLSEIGNVSENTNLALYTGYYAGTKLMSTMSAATHEDEYESDAYAQQLYKQVLPEYKTFDLDSREAYVRPFSKGEIYSVLFVGGSGTGKTTCSYVIPYRCGLPYISINCSTNIEESDFVGTMIPNPCKASADDPEFIWKDGLLTKAVRYGYVMVVNEINFARPGILGKFNSLLDDTRQIELPTGEIVKAHKNFRIIATANIAYEGTNKMNAAFVNRFDVTDIFKELPRKKVMSIVKDRTGYSDVTKLGTLYNIYAAIVKYSDENNLGLVVSIRQLIELCRIGKYYKTAEDAVLSVMVNQAFLHEPEHLDYFIKNVMKNTDLSFKI